MEFFIRKNATLPVLEINLLKDGRLDYNYKKTNLTGATITLSMVNVDTGFYKITNGVCVCEINVTTDQGTVILPLRDKIFVTVLDSFVDSDFCCGLN